VIKQLSNIVAAMEMLPSTFLWKKPSVFAFRATFGYGGASF
jgi:hypothetical protein